MFYLLFYDMLELLLFEFYQLHYRNEPSSLYYIFMLLSWLEKKLILYYLRILSVIKCIEYIPLDTCE